MRTSLRSLLAETKQCIHAAPDHVSLERARLVTQAYRLHAGAPMPLRRARAFAHILHHMTLDLDTNPLFAGNVSPGPRAWMLLPEYGFSVPAQALVEKPALATLLDDDVVPDDLRAFWKKRALGGDAGIGHLIPDHARVLATGLDAIACQAEQAPDDGSEQAVFRRAMAVGCRAVIAWAARYAGTAEIAARRGGDPLRAACLRRVAAACRRVPAYPPRDLFEALQAVALLHMAVHIEGHGYSVSLGRLDQVLLPYYDPARDNDDLSELLAAFMLVLEGNALWGSHSKTQPITLGGIQVDGRDASNPLARAFMVAWELISTPEPVLFLRWHGSLPRDIKERAAGMLAAGRNMPMLVGDRATIAGLVSARIAANDAADYAIIGCNELGVPGKLMWESVAIHGAGLIRELLIERAAALPSMAAFLAALEERATAKLLAEVRWRLDARQREAACTPTPFTSALMDGCLESGVDLVGGLPYMSINVRDAGFANTVNSLAAIARVIYDEKLATPADLAAALEADYAGHEPLRRALCGAATWGNDDSATDRWALAWLEVRDRACRRVEQVLGIPRLLPELVTRSLHHLEGARLAATPDGRRAGDPLGDSVGAVLGSARRGPTALMASVCGMNAALHWPGGYNLNISLPATRWSQPGALDEVIALVDGFFDSGGQELQLAVLDADTLREARAHPDRHPDLIVRVAGFNARFGELSTVEQDELIARAEAVG